MNVQFLSTGNGDDDDDDDDVDRSSVGSTDSKQQLTPNQRSDQVSLAKNPSQSILYNM